MARLLGKLKIDIKSPSNRRRYLVKETFSDVEAFGCTRVFRLKKWTYTYSDGDVEVVTVMYNIIDMV